MILSFGWTTPALLAGAKTCTRRDWKPEHAARFKAGMLVDAWNSLPRNVAKNPRKVAVIRLTQDPVLEFTTDAREDDWFAEGFDYLNQHGALINGVSPAALWDQWTSPDTGRQLYVVRFEVVELLEAPNAS